jgi:hypothetical protein
VHWRNETHSLLEKDERLIVSYTSRRRCKMHLTMFASVFDPSMTIVTELQANLVLARVRILMLDFLVPSARRQRFWRGNNSILCNLRVKSDKAVPELPLKENVVLEYACGMMSMYPRASNWSKDRIAAHAPEPEANDAGCVKVADCRHARGMDSLHRRRHQVARYRDLATLSRSKLKDRQMSS